MNTTTSVYHWSVLYLQRDPRVGATDQAFVWALCGLRQQVHLGLLCADTSTQVDARLHITEGKDNDVEPLSTEDRSRISFSPRNLHQSIRVPLGQTTFLAMQQGTATLLTPRGIPPVTAPFTHKIWVGGP